MKKIFLCAVALSIFSFDAKAEGKKEISKIEKNETLGEPCADGYAADLHNLQSLGMDFLDAHHLASAYFYQCLDEKYNGGNGSY